MATVSAEDLQGMAEHWMHTPVNGYFGSGYGADPKSLLQKPASSGIGDRFLQKLMDDIPVMKQLPANALNVYFDQDKDAKDRKRLLLQILDGTVVFTE